MKAWLVSDGDFGPDSGVRIYHAETRGQAKRLGYDEMGSLDYTSMRARRVPSADDKDSISDADYLSAGCWVECHGCPRECTTDGNYGQYAVGVPDEAGNVWCDECREGGPR